MNIWDEFPLARSETKINLQLFWLTVALMLLSAFSKLVFWWSVGNSTTGFIFLRILLKEIHHILVSLQFYRDSSFVQIPPKQGLHVSLYTLLLQKQGLCQYPWANNKKNFREQSQQEIWNKQHATTSAWYCMMCFVILPDTWCANGSSCIAYTW